LLNRNKTVKRKHDSNSDDDSTNPNNNVTNVSEPVPTPAKKPKNKKPIELGDLEIISSHLKYARNALIE
jgi:hypothetical protein